MLYLAGTVFKYTFHFKLLQASLTCLGQGEDPAPGHRGEPPPQVQRAAVSLRGPAAGQVRARGAARPRQLRDHAAVAPHPAPAGPGQPGPGPRSISLTLTLVI